MPKPTQIQVVEAIANEIDVPAGYRILRACKRKGRASKQDLRDIVGVALKENPHCYNNPQIRSMMDLDTVGRRNPKLGKVIIRQNRGPLKLKLRVKKLTKAARARLPASSFVFPRTRKYPINDMAHGRLALIYAMSPTNAKDRKKVKSAVFKKYPSLKRWWNSTNWVKSHKGQRVK
jgi:hypothetical protein